jgi:hypothetical protein
MPLSEQVACCQKDVRKRWTLSWVFFILLVMKTEHYGQVTASEQEVLDGIELRLIESNEQKRFDDVIEEHHYLHRGSGVRPQESIPLKNPLRNGRISRFLLRVRVPSISGCCDVE